MIMSSNLRLGGGFLRVSHDLNLINIGSLQQQGIPIAMEDINLVWKRMHGHIIIIIREQRAKPSQTKPGRAVPGQSWGCLLHLQPTTWDAGQGQSEAPPSSLLSLFLFLKTSQQSTLLQRGYHTRREEVCNQTNKKPHTHTDGCDVT